MKLSELTEQVKEYEKRLAYGSETILWGMYNEQMRQITGFLPYKLDYYDEDPEIDTEECEWWIAAYDMMEDLEDEGHGDEFDTENVDRYISTGSIEDVDE